MSRINSRPELQCPIDLFEPQQAKIEMQNKAINAAWTASEKAQCARVLIDEVNVLLDCGSYDQANQNCRTCRNFSELRMKAADLVVRTGGLGAANQPS